MAAQTLRKGLSIAREAIQNTGRGEQALYVLLMGAGALLVILGWRAEVHGWATGHPYFVGLLDGATGFCFGVPVAGVVIREITHRASQSAERRITVHTVTAQLDYLDRLVEGLSPGPIQSARDSLRHLAGIARWAAPGASAIAKEAATSFVFGGVAMGGTTVLPTIYEQAATELRHVVEADLQWASVEFSCSRLASDVSRLMAVLHPHGAPQSEFPGWLDDLVGALQALLGIQLPADRRWLPAAVQQPPAEVPVTQWMSPLWQQPAPQEPAQQTPFTYSRQADQQTGANERMRLLNAAQERAANELRDELADLARHLDALAVLVDAAATCRSELNPFERR